MARPRLVRGDNIACGKCPAVFPSLEKRKLHNKAKHQQNARCLIYDANGKPVNHVVERIDGVFKCPQCVYTSSIPKTLRQHSQRCKPTRDCQEKRCIPAETLLEVGVEYNVKLGLIICALCRYALPSGCKEVASHFRRIHRISLCAKTLAKKFEPLLFSSNLTIQQYLQPLQALMEPVAGIEIKPGFKCCHCAYFTPLKATMNKHLRSSHSILSETMSEVCMVQSLYSGTRTKYFGIHSKSVSHIIDGGVPASETSEAVSRLINDYDLKSSRVAPTDERLIPPFLRRMKWHETIKKYCTENVLTVMASVSFHRDSKLVKLLHPVVCQYWKLGQELIGTREYLFERMFSSKGIEIVSSSKLRRIQTKGPEYCQTMTSLLLMVDSHANNSIITSSDLGMNDLSQKLGDLLTSRENSFALSDSDEVRADDVGVDQLQLLDNVLDAIFRINLEHEHSPSEFLAFPTHRFIVCSSIINGTQDMSGFVQFKQPGQITRVVAMLQSWARLSAMMRLYERSWGVEAELNNEITRSRAESLSFFLKVGFRTPFNLLQEIMSFGSTIAMAPEQRRLPQIAWLTSNFTELLVEGQRVTLDTLLGVKTLLIARFRRALHDTVLLGYSVSSVKEMLQSKTQYFHDDYSNYSCGYSFLEDDRNPWKKLRMDLVKYLLQTHSSRFIANKTNGEIKFCIPALSAWCEMVDKLTKILAPLVYIISGQPSRAAELSATTIRNTVSGERSVYMLDTEVMLVQRYHKGLSISGQHRVISRFLPKELALYFIVYLALVRPAHDFFSTHLQNEELASRNSKIGDTNFYYLFNTTRQGHLNGKACREAINSSFLSCNTQLSVRTYRHVAIAFMEKHVKSTRSDQDMFDFQAAHAPITASTMYSRSTRDPYFMSRDDMVEFRSCSHQWHKFLGFESGESDLSQSLSTAIPTNTTSTPVLIDAYPVNRTVGHNDVLQPRAITTIEPTYGQMSIAQANNCLRPEHYISARTQLRSFLRDECAEFRSTEQCTSMTLILQSVSNVLAVLPTNGGKSLLYQLAAFCDNSRVVVVVVPLIALLMDSLRKTTGLGISCSEYNHDMSPFTEIPSVLFVGVNYLEQQKFRLFLLSLSEQDKISRIVFDEAHLALTAQDYRSCMASVYFLSSLPVQKTLLTATLPPTWENELATAFGFSFVTVRTPTPRPSLCYKVKEVATYRDMQTACLDIVCIPMVHPNKGIIFALTKSMVEELVSYLARRTGSLFARYHSDMSVDERKESIETWKSLNCSYIVATCGLGQGVDYAHVRTVIHFGLAHSLIDFAQETGRSGRDDQISNCVTVYSEVYFQRIVKRYNNVSPTDFRQLKSLKEFRAFALDKTHCRRQLLQEAMDGISFPCPLQDSNVFCDVCASVTSTNVSRRETANASRNIRSQSKEANSLIMDDERIYLVFQRLLFNDESTHCTVCWVCNSSQLVHHLPHECAHQAGRCFKCLAADHPAQMCPNQLVFGSRSPSCFFCGVPLANILGKHSLHFRSPPGASCTTRMRGKMILGVWKFYEICKARSMAKSGIEGRICLMSKQEFSKWLVEVRAGRIFTNLCMLWAYITTLYSN